MRANRILIVDDNLHNTAIVRRILGDGYDIVDTNTGEEALEIVERYCPDIVLLDIMLPGVDGYQVCRQIKANPNLPNTKIIMVTAKAMINEKLVGYEAGADDYVTKPFDGEELLAKVKVYLRLKTIEEHESLKSQLLTLLGHEARTPMTYVLAAAQNLADTGELGAQESEFAAIINDGVSRISDILTKVLRYGELKSGSNTEAMEPTDVRVVVENVVSRLSTKADAKGVTVTRHGQDTHQVMADGSSLDEAFAIILDNAIGFSPDGGVVDVEVIEVDDAVTIATRDRGPGIPKDVLPTLFDGLSTYDVAHHSKGHGLNLAIARAIVEAHGGALEAFSEEKHETTFAIRLPVSKEATLLATHR